MSGKLPGVPYGERAAMFTCVYKPREGDETAGEEGEGGKERGGWSS